MAQHLKDAACCPICLTYLEEPMNLKCGFICCRRCLPALTKGPGGEGVLCFNCSEVSQPDDIKPNRVLGRLVSRVKEMEPQLTPILRMDPRIRKFHVAMTLDVDTAHNYLTISEDLQRVRIGDRPQGRRAHPGRFNDSPCVLGSPRFTSGRHYWEVDVGGSRQWSLGLCRESAPRQGEAVLSSELGFWTLSCQEGDRLLAGTDRPLGLPVQPRPRRLGLFLDVEMGIFSFYHVADGSHVFTFPVSAEEPLRPFFGPAGPAGDENWLALCP